MLVKPIILPKPDETNQKEKELYDILDKTFSDIRAVLNRGITFDDNVGCRIIQYTTNATPDTEDSVAHGLGKIPTGYLVSSINKAAILYNGVSAWDSNNIYLKCNAASVTVNIIVF